MSDSGTATAKLLDSLFNGCWSCGAFNTLGAIGLSFADNVFAKLADGMTILIGLFMALWVLWFAAKLFLPFGTPGASHWNMGAGKLFRLLIVLAFLQTSGPFWNYIFIPILSTGLGIASQLATATDQFDSAFGNTSALPATNGQGIDYCAPGQASPDPRIPLSSAASAAYTALTQMDCPLSRMQGAYAKGIAVGVATIGHMDCDTKSGTWSLPFVPTLQELTYFVSGLIVIAAYLWGFMIFPFLLIDVLARVILVAATSPLAIAATLFRLTARIAERSVWTLAQCGFTLMFGAAISGICRALIAYILAQMSTNGVSLTNWDGLSSTVENACAVGFEVDFATASFYMLVGTAIITIFMMRRAASLAAELTGISGSTGLQAGVAAIAGSAAAATGRLAQGLYRGHRDGAGTKARQVTGNDPGPGRGSGSQSGKVSGTAPD